VTRLQALIVHNTSAGDGSVDPATVRVSIEAQGYVVAYRTTDDDGWRDEIRQTDVAVAIGGDGTLRRVFLELVDSDVPILVVAAGTANNIARALGMPVEDPIAHISDVDTSDMITFDVPVMTIGTRRELFVETVGGGVFGKLLARIESEEQTTGLLAGLRHLKDLVTTAEPQTWSIEGDGVDLSGDFIAVEVMNIKETCPNVMLAPRASFNDGLLDLVLVGPTDRDDLLAAIDRRIAGETSVRLDLPSRQCRSLRLGVPIGTPVRRDDQVEQAIHEPTISIEMTGHAVRLVVPRPRPC